MVVPHKSVVIIGGGMSGVKTAIDLYNGGIKDTLILEATSRLGGRILTMKSLEKQGTVYDLGASWFHDSLKNPLFDKAIALGDVEYYFDDGKSIFFNETEPNIETWKFDTVVSEFFTYSALQYTDDPLKKDMSIMEMCFEYCEAFRNRLSSHQLKYCPSVIRMWAELWLGESWDKLSAKYSLQENFDNHLGRNVLVKSGYEKVLINEIKELPRVYRDSSIKLNAQVWKIDYTSSNKIYLHLTDERRYSCDYLVITIPQSILKIDNPRDPSYIQWVPKVPQCIGSALEDINFGSLGKVVLEFKECFWPRDVDRFYALTSNVPSDNVKPWDFPALIINYQSICEVASLVILTQNPISQYIEDLCKKSNQDKVWSLFKPLIAQISDNMVGKIPNPTNLYCTPWNNHIFSRGSYGVSLVGTKDPSKVIRNFVERDYGNEERIRFAGAETVDGSANGCVHGAWLSGEREASAILKMIQMTPGSSYKSNL
ncbi:hypothetical protein KGF56_001884 [Candida oxycetoniae]|uniref:Amine oxidase domain-containing protein n=1 Tax=Candida oxycetoniae TaxID=497107 RepID=A0AAI9SYV0_9ASCO|nr:uncharacterized protein KGF56_001884 [Candida oxycetoniae]KAI3405312.2 hypothetical protein KGF56_001884 [Candida oxycetoniae]